METSGILLVALTKEAGQELNRQFRDREVNKTYVALVEGHLSEDHGEISLPLSPDLDDRPRQVVDKVNGKPATTLWKVLSRQEAFKKKKTDNNEDASNISSGRDSRSNSTTLLELKPITGRTHQLRVHMQVMWIIHNCFPSVSLVRLFGSISIHNSLSSLRISRHMMDTIITGFRPCHCRGHSLQ
jgi:tRNA pseudouridine32 synthase / 23S rRNA pseudouridine746 synthase